LYILLAILIMVMFGAHIRLICHFAIG